MEGSARKEGHGPHSPTTEAGTEYSMHELRVLKRHLEERRDLFRFCADYYGWVHYALVIQSFVLTIVAGSVATVWPHDYCPVCKEVIIAGFCGISAVLQVVNNQFRSQSKMDIFMNSAQLMDSLQYKARWRIVFSQQHAITAEVLEQLGTEIAARVLEVRENAPPIPLWLEAKADRAREKLRTADKFDADWENVNFDEEGHRVGKATPAQKSPEKQEAIPMASRTDSGLSMDSIEPAAGPEFARKQSLKMVPKPSELLSISAQPSSGSDVGSTRRSLMQSRRKDIAPLDPEAQRERQSTDLHYYGGQRHRSPRPGGGGFAKGGGAFARGGGIASNAAARESNAPTPEECPTISKVTSDGAAA